MSRLNENNSRTMGGENNNNIGSRRNQTSTTTGGNGIGMSENPQPFDYQSDEFIAQITSFDAFSSYTSTDKKTPLRQVPARINIIAASGSNSKYVDFKRVFTSVIYLLKSHPIYTLIIMPSNMSISSSGQKKCDLAELREVKVKKGEANTLTLEFETWDATIQFKRQIKFEYFRKVLQIVCRVLDENYVESVTKGLRFRQDVCRYRCVDQSKKKGGGGMIDSAIRFSQRVVTKKEKEFYAIKAEDWLPKHYRLWLQYIFVEEVKQKKSKKKKKEEKEKEGTEEKIVSREIVSVYDRLMKLNLFDQVESYFLEGNTLFNLKSEISKFLKEGSIPENSRKIKTLYNHPDLLKKLKHEVELIQKNDSRFNMNYTCVLLKRISKKKKDLKLRDIENDLNIKRRFWWDVEECRDQILSLLLYEKDIDNYVKDRELDFLEFEKLKLKELYKKKGKTESIISSIYGDDDELGSGYEDIPKIGGFYPHEIDPDDWKVILEEFNKKHDIKIEELSFRVWIKYIQNNLRVEKKKEMDEYNKLGNVKVEKEKAIREKNIQIEQQENRISTYTDKLLEFMETKPKMVPNMEKLIERTEKKVNQLKIEVEKLEKDLKQFAGNENEKEKNLEKDSKEKKHNEKINECRPEMMMFLKSNFISDKKRRRQITKYLKSQLDKKAKEGMVEFVVKLVLAIKKGENPEGWQKKVMAMIDPFVKPAFYKWGFLHASALIANLGIHWFSNSLVFLKNLAMEGDYEEIIAIDGYCPLILNYKTAYGQIGKLAEKMVSANVNNTYCPYSVLSSGDSLNCQEFALELLKALEYTPFFPVVDKFLVDLKAKLSKTKEDTEMRFFTPDKMFHEKFFKKVLKSKLNKEGRVVFKSHRELDEFYIECTNVDPHFELNYPGVVMLLKGFDRAYWMRFSKNKANPVLAPSKIRCPMK